MQPQQHKQDENKKAVKWINPLNQNQFIVFRSSVPAKVTALSMQLNNKQKNKQFDILYNELTGCYSDYDGYFCQCLQDIIQILQNVSEIGGSEFKGMRYHTQDINYNNPYQIEVGPIQKITFSNLKFLDFSYCYLKNIQAFAWLDMKNIEEINLTQNSINCLKMFTKINVTELKIIDISLNPLSYHSYKNLQRIHSPKLQYLQTGKIKKDTKFEFLQDFRPLSKLQLDSERWKKQNNLTVKCNKQSQKLQQNKWKLVAENQTLFKLYQS